MSRRAASAKSYNFEKQIAELTDEINRVPDDYEAYSERGAIYKKNKNYNLAVEDYTAAIERMPSISSDNASVSWNLYYGLAESYENLGAYEKADAFWVLLLKHTYAGTAIREKIDKIRRKRK
jgi:tetratricopeptide (TPR) repeat protein